MRNGGKLLQIPLRAVVLLAVLLGEAAGGTTYYSGAIDGMTRCQQATVNFTAGVLNIALQFRISNMPFSNTLLVPSFAPLVCSDYSLALLSALQTARDPLLATFDARAATAGQLQVINLAVPRNASTLYLAVFNFDSLDPTADKAYVIGVTYIQGGKMCLSCASGTTLAVDPNNPLACQCQPCPEDYVGATCAIHLQPLRENTQADADLVGRSNLFFRIKNPPASIDLSFKEYFPTNSVFLYMQYELEPGMVAGAMNNYYDASGLPFTKLLTTELKNLTLPTYGRNILLTFSHPSSGLASIAITYTNSDKKNILAIALGVSFGVAAIIAVIAIIVCIRRRRSQARAIRNTQTEAKENSLFLDDQDTEYYFPTVIAGDVLFFEEADNDSRTNMMDEVDNRSTKTSKYEKHECTVCLTEIDRTSRLKVTYCRHMFHQVCLAMWFKKNQNCPVCRREFSQQTTHAYFKKLQRRKQAVQGKDLVVAILGKKNKPPLKERKLKQLEKELEMQPMESRDVLKADEGAVADDTI